MINVTPMYGNWTDDLMANFPEVAPPEPTLYEEEAERESQVLGPDGEPFFIAAPKRPFGFDLRPRSMRNA